MAKKSRLSSGGKKTTVILYAVVAFLALVGMYYAYTYINLGKEDSSAGSAQKITLEGYTLTLENVRSGFMRTTSMWQKRVPQSADYWTYAIAGPASSCYIAKVVVDSPTEKEKKIVSSKTTIDLQLTPIPNCDESKKIAGTVTKMNRQTGSFFASSGSTFEYIVTYEGKVGTSLVETANKDLKLSVVNVFEKKIARNRLNYQLVGVTTSCYTPSVIAPSGATGTRSYTAKMSYKTSAIAGCEKTKQDVKLSGLAAQDFGTLKLDVKYVQSGTLTSTTTNSAAKTLTSEGFTLTYTFLGNNTWSYIIKGNLPNSCYTAMPSVIVSKSLPEKVSVKLATTTVKTIKACSDVVYVYETKGTVPASQSAMFTFTADPVKGSVIRK